MKKYQLLAVFNHAHELASVKTLLESENIDCQVKDELTAQVYTLSSNALGGIKLLVHPSEIDRARLILNESPYLVDSQHENDFLKKIAKLTENIPILKSLRVELRLLILATVFFGILVFGVLKVMS